MLSDCCGKPDKAEQTAEKGKCPRITRRIQRVMWPVLSSFSHQLRQLRETKYGLCFKPWNGKLPQKPYLFKSEKEESRERVPSAQELRSPKNKYSELWVSGRSVALGGKEWGGNDGYIRI